MEKNQQKLWEILVENRKEIWEILARDREEHQEQMAQMMQVIMRMAREKESVDDIGFVDTATLTQRATEASRYHVADFAMPDERTPHCLVPPLSNAMLKTYFPLPTLMPFGGVYTYSNIYSLAIPNLSVSKSQIEIGPVKEKNKKNPSCLT